MKRRSLKPYFTANNLSTYWQYSPNTIFHPTLLDTFLYVSDPEYIIMEVWIQVRSGLHLDLVLDPGDNKLYKTFVCKIFKKCRVKVVAKSFLILFQLRLHIRCYSCFLLLPWSRPASSMRIRCRPIVDLDPKHCSLWGLCIYNLKNVKKLRSQIPKLSALAW